MASNTTTQTASVGVSGRAIRQLASKMSGAHVYRSRIYKLLATYTSSKEKIKLTSVYEHQAQRKLQQKDKRGATFFGYLNELTRHANYSPLKALGLLLPKDEVAIIEAHPSDTIGEGFKRASFLALKKQEILAAFTSSMMMPIMAILVGIGTAYYSLSKQVPVYLTMLPEAYWPSIARFLMPLYAMFVSHWPVTVGVLVTVVLWIKLYSLKRPPGGHRRFCDRLPPWTVQRQLQSSMFMTSLGVMLKQGRTLRQSLEAMSEVAPVYLAVYQRQMLALLKANVPVSQVIASDLFDADTRNYLSDFVEKASFPDLLIELGEERLNEMAQNVANLAIIVGSLFIMLAALLNAYIVLAGFSLNQAMIDFYR